MSAAARNDQKIARSIAFMSQHLNERIKMTQLAEMVGLSSSYFWALFKQKTGYAPVDFLIRLRMHQACHLLNSTNLTVKTIAAALGYTDSFYFSRLFKSVHGVAPANYQRSEQPAARLCLPPLTLSPVPKAPLLAANQVPERINGNTVPRPRRPALRQSQVNETE
jgi:AraC-like DNA-binding protein